jgi:hypothetical protein
MFGLLTVLLLVPVLARADAFDRYINTILEKVPEADGVLALKQLTAAQILEHSQVLPDATACFVVVQTNEGRLCKALLQSARQKMSDEAKTVVPIVLVEKFVTYRPGTEQAVQVQGGNLYLFDGFHVSLDLGQVVPPQFGGDLRFVAKDGQVYLEPLGNAKLFLLTKPLEAAAAKKGEKFTIGEAFEPRYFAGKFKLHDDGRRSGTLTLEVDAEQNVTGTYVSDRDGQKYMVYGKVNANPKHSIQFLIKFPKTEQVFRGWMYTGNGLSITGWSKMQEREAGFHAVRIEE